MTFDGFSSDELEVLRRDFKNMDSVCSLSNMDSVHYDGKPHSEVTVFVVL